MFDIGFTELVVIALVGLIVLGPKRLPEVARTAGQWLGRLRRFMTDVKQDFDRELQDAELAELRNLKQELDETRRTLEQTSGKLMQQVSAVPDELEAAADTPVRARSAPAPAAEQPPPSIGAGEGAQASPALAGNGEGAHAPAPGRKRTGARRRKPAAKRAHEPSE